MAHYAFLDASGVVTQVIVGKDEGAGVDYEAYYAAVRKLPADRCKRTSYNTIAGQHLAGGVPYRKNYAGIGFTYDAGRDAFIPPKPGDDWTLDEASCTWIDPAESP